MVNGTIPVTIEAPSVESSVIRNILSEIVDLDDIVLDIGDLRNAIADVYLSKLVKFISSRRRTNLKSGMFTVKDLTGRRVSTQAYLGQRVAHSGNMSSYKEQALCC